MSKTKDAMIDEMNETDPGQPHPLAEAAVNVRKLANLMDRIAVVVPENTTFWLNENTVNLCGITEDDNRKLMGLMLRELKVKPTVKKPYEGATNLEARFNLDGVTVRLSDYKPRTCKIVEKTVVVAAQPAREAIPEHTKIVSELVCDLGDGDVAVE